MVLLTLVLFFYAAFFYEPSPIERKISEDQIAKKLKLNKMPDDIHAMLGEMTRLTNLQTKANTQFKNFKNSDL